MADKLFLLYASEQNQRSSNFHNACLVPAADAAAARTAAAADAATRDGGFGPIASWAAVEVASDNASIEAPQWFSGVVARPLLAAPGERVVTPESELEPQPGEIPLSVAADILGRSEREMFAAAHVEGFPAARLRRVACNILRPFFDGAAIRAWCGSRAARAPAPVHGADNIWRVNRESLEDLPLCCSAAQQQ
jgi:hypothetical protein